MFFAPCAHGLERLLLAEVKDCGGRRPRIERGGVRFVGDVVAGYRLCLWSRVATTVQQEVQRGAVADVHALYGFARSVDWKRVLAPTHTFTVSATVSGLDAPNSRYAAQRVQDAVLDAVLDHQGGIPTVNRQHPDVVLRLTVSDGRAVLCRDLSGTGLEHRTWRPRLSTSRVNEALAAGLVLLSGWDRRSLLVDPLCDSGAIAIEAAHLAGDRAPGLRRSFAFEGWPDVASEAWAVLRDEAEERAAVGATEIPPLLAYESDPGTAGVATDNTVRAEVAHYVVVRCAELGSVPAPPGRSWLITTPPWAREPGARSSPRPIWRNLGELVARSAGAQAWVLSGNPTLIRHLGLSADEVHSVRNGALDCRFLHLRRLPRLPYSHFG